MKTDIESAKSQFPALNAPDAELCARVALEWYLLTPEMAKEVFTADCIYENRCDQGTLVVGPEEIFKILEVYRSMCDRFEGTLLNILESNGVVLLEREELTFLKNGQVCRLPVMDSFVVRDGKIARFTEYWDLALLTKQLMVGEEGEEVEKLYRQYQADSGQDGG